MKQFLRILNLWLPVFICAAAIFYSSSQPAISVSSDKWQDFVFHKLAHVVLYAILSALLFRANLGGEIVSKKNSVRYFIFSVTLAILYGVSDEIHQLFVPSREGRLRDVFIDAIGALIGGVFAWKLFQKTVKKHTN